MRPLIVLIAMSAIGTSILGGCGSSGGASPAASKVVANDFSFTPADIQATAGKAITIEFANEGTLTHNFSISELGVSKDFESGKNVTVTVTPKQAGTLQFFCKYHNAQGMKGSLSVS